MPGGVNRVHVIAVGGAGQGIFQQGGAGAQVTSDLDVTPGTTLFAEVGIGGGAGGNGGDGATGGGESDVRTCSVADPSCPALGGAQDPRLVVAGGGGGAGCCAGGGAGGAAGTGVNIPCNAGIGGDPGFVGTTGAGGGGGGCTSGGSEGAGGSGGGAGIAGSAGSGGAGGSGGGHAGGGGGAGYFGGGGGGNGGDGINNSGGGGGGSSFGPAGSTFTLAATDQSVVISYQATAADLAAILVSDSTGKSPGTSLVAKATAIQQAVTAGQTAVACADITDYVRLVKAQTAKKLTPAQANQLTTDATNLATVLAC